MKISEAQTEKNIETIISPVFSNLLSQKPNGSKESKKEEEKEEKNQRKKGYLFLLIFLLLLGAAAYYVLRDGGITGRVVGDGIVLNTTNETLNTTPSLPQECQGYGTLESVNSQLSSTGAFIKNLSYSDGVCNVFIQLDGITEIRVLTPDITGLSARTFDIQDDRLSTKMVKLTGSFNYANVSAVKLTEELTLYLLECVEFKGEECNRWRLIDGTPRNKVQALQNYLEYTVYGHG
ncbi:MAG: hypothetical protein AABW92_04235, partial [Nanoarchaeota archaeon]